MAPKILLADNPLSAMDIARELAPSGFDVVIARAGSAEFNAAPRPMPNTSSASAKLRWTMRSTGRRRS